MPEVHVPDLDEGHVRPSPTAVRTRSWLKIGLEVALITTGVFLGLLGEQWRENAGHRELAQQALRRFRAEFAANTAEVERVHGRHVRQLQALQKYFAEHQADLKATMLDAGKPLPQPIPDMTTDSAGVAYSAWDVALATESLAYIDPDLVAAMSSAYRLQQVYEDAHRNIQRTQYSGTPAFQMMRGHAAYFGDASNYEELMLKHYAAIMARLDKAGG